MKLQGIRVWKIALALNKAVSTVGTARHAIKVNKRRFGEGFKDILDWLEEHKDEYGYAFYSAPDGNFTLNFADSDSGAQAFRDYLLETEFTVEPYVFTEEAFIDINGITEEEEAWLEPLTIENYKKYLQKEKVEEDDGGGDS